jgi:hypothetical protein
VPTTLAADLTSCTVLLHLLLPLSLLLLLPLLLLLCLQVHRGSWCGIDVSAKQYFAAEDMASSRSVNSGLYSNFGQLVRARVS